MKYTEKQLKRKLGGKGYRLDKSMTKTTNADNQGGYMIVDLNSRKVVDGSRYELTLEDVEDFFNQL